VPTIDKIAQDIPTFSKQAPNMFKAIYKKFDRIYEK